MSIERTLFWFKDLEVLTSLTENFMGLGYLLNRLLNERYEGKKIKFINIEFYTNRTYELYPALPKETPYFYGGHLNYYGSFDKDDFLKLNNTQQHYFIWEKSHQYLIESAKAMKNNSLAEAADYANRKGLQIDLDPNYRVIDTLFIISGKEVRASVWINFDENNMYSKFTLEQLGNIIFERELDRVRNGIEVFLEMYKAIELKKDSFLIKGHRDIPDLPIKIPLSEISVLLADI